MKGKDRGRIPEPEKARELNVASVTHGDITWVNIERPTDREIEYLSQNYSFHQLELDDCLSRIQRPKIDTHKDYLFVVLHFPVFNKRARVTTPSQVSVFIGEKFLVTIHKGELKPLVKLFRECQIDETSRPEFFELGSGYLLYRILDRLVDYCLPILNKMGDNIEQVEDNIFNDGIKGVIREISLLRRDVISFRRTIWPMRAVIGGLESRVRRFTRMNLEDYFGDMVDHVDKIWDGLDEYKEIIEGLNDTHDSLATNRTNEVVRTLTIIATVLLPITVVASIYGMNIEHLPFATGRFSFPIVLLIMGVIIGLMLYWFRRKHVI
jgi:magnesium transporter